MREGVGPFQRACLVSVLVNVRMLTGSLFLLWVHDRVQGRPSAEMLLALAILTVFLLAVLGFWTGYACGSRCVGQQFTTCALPNRPATADTTGMGGWEPTSSEKSNGVRKKTNVCGRSGLT